MNVPIPRVFVYDTSEYNSDHVVGLNEVLYKQEDELLVVMHAAIYSVILKDGLNFVRLYFLNYTWYVNDLHNI
jgi:hypothetical protein